MIFRRLAPSDPAAYRHVRLRGLRHSPAAFGSSFREEAKWPLKTFARRLEQTGDHWTFGAFAGRRLVGLLSVVRNERLKERHKAEIVGMYVDPEMRRQGIGHGLLGLALATARQLRGVRQVRLAVVGANRPARQLYECMGFKVYGREKDALRVGGRFYTMLYLDRRLAGPPYPRGSAVPGAGRKRRTPPRS